MIVWIRIAGRWVARWERLFDRFVERCFPTLAFRRIAVGIAACRIVHDGLDMSSSYYQWALSTPVAIPTIRAHTAMLACHCVALAAVLNSFAFRRGNVLRPDTAS